MDDVTVTRLINGPEAFTPDNEFCLGESEVRGFFVAAGFCAHGLAGAGGIGKVMAEWIVEGEPALDLWHMDIRRFGPHYRSPAYTLKRTREVYETYYDIRYPGHEREAGRPLRVSSAYEWHREHGAAFGEKSGWERVNWYESNAAAGDEALRPHGWAGMLWSPAIGAEHRAARETAGLFDESSFAKLEVSGPGAAELLERLCDNRVAREVGQITYTQMLNRRGGIECDFTVARLAEDRFGIVTGTAFGNHDASWIRSHLPDDGSVTRHRRDRALGLLRPVGAARPRDPRAADPRPARLRLHAPARDHGRRRAGARAARDLRRRVRLGALLPDRVRRRPVARRCGRPAARTACSPAATARSTRCGSRRATACGPPTSPRTRRRSRRGSSSACARDKQFIGSDALVEPAAAPARDHARGPARGRARQRAGRGVERRDRRAGHERRLRLHGRALDRLRLPAGRVRGRRRPSRSTSSASGSAGEVAAEPLFDPERGADPRMTATVMLASAARRARARAGGLARQPAAARRLDHRHLLGRRLRRDRLDLLRRRPRRARPPPAARDPRHALGRCGSPATSPGATTARARTAATSRCASATATASG